MAGFNSKHKNMKLLKLFYHGAPIEVIYPNAHWVQKGIFKVRKFIRKSLILGTIGGLMVASASIGALTFSSRVVVASEPEVVVAPAPVLDRIADCESGTGKAGSATHFKNGQVVMNANTNGTIDIGKYQVNLTYWGKKATDLGLDLTKEVDNKKMAEFIYQNYGTGDWSASQKCWYRAK